MHYDNHPQANREAEEFCEGVPKVKGNAKSLDIVSWQADVFCFNRARRL